MFLVQSFNSVPGARMFLRNLIRAACQLYYSNLSGVWIKLFVESKYVLRKVSTEDYHKSKIFQKQSFSTENRFPPKGISFISRTSKTIFLFHLLENFITCCLINLDKQFFGVKFFFSLFYLLLESSERERLISIRGRIGKQVSFCAWNYIREQKAYIEQRSKTAINSDRY